MRHNGPKKILVAPLNWGLGHATRCIPIINALVKQNFEPIIASDGNALALLQKEFPQLKKIDLPSYNITYSKKGNNFRKKLLFDSPHLLKTIKKENKLIKKLVKTEGISGIISDNRFGVRAKGVPSVFITHQLKVLSGSTTWLSTKLHQKIIEKFDQCWVPDHKGEHNLSGDLGQSKIKATETKYLGPLSRFTKQNLEIKYDLLVVLSGPEPQRTYLEQKLFNELELFKGDILFVKGLLEATQTIEHKNHITIYNFMTSNDLEKAINESALVLSRSGYTTIMDLAKLEKKAFFIPTPGQFEQEYLAKKLSEERIIPSCNQDEFKVDMLNKLDEYTGFISNPFEIDFKKLFSLFKGK
ncbi:glycosyltransferase [Winogradskyella sp. A2]|uniref:glycosyltransferase n=1 Tax=Winogradskyella sp. A2 TaxID=3366944 RepID=UPI00398C51F1